MEKFLTFITNINFLYILLIILILIVSNIYLNNHHSNNIIKIIFNISYLTISIISFKYLTGILNSIFQLKYLSVKLYLLMIAGTNLIILYTINTPLKRGYKILNYLLFIILTIIFGSTIAVLLGNRFEELYIMDVSNAINFIDLSFIIFIIYLIILASLYISYHFLTIIKTKKEAKVPSKTLTLKVPKRTLKKKNKATGVLTTKEPIESKTKKLTTEELLNYQLDQGFYINGVECSIIFEDSNQQNIITNYNILLNDINARLVNGYTLTENQMLKSICSKLKVNNLSLIDLHNMSILNKISIEEYEFLKKVLT